MAPSPAGVRRPRGEGSRSAAPGTHPQAAQWRCPVAPATARASGPRSATTALVLRHGTSQSTPSYFGDPASPLKSPPAVAAGDPSAPARPSRAAPEWCGQRRWPPRGWALWRTPGTWQVACRWVKDGGWKPYSKVIGKQESYDTAGDPHRRRRSRCRGPSRTAARASSSAGRSARGPWGPDRA